MQSNEQNISTTERVRGFLLDLIFPTKCLGCGQFSKTNVCPLCCETVKLQNGFSCAFCRAPVVNGITCPFCRRDHALDQLLVALSYDQPLVKTGIKAFKYRFVESVGVELAVFMVAYLQRVLKNGGLTLTETVVVPVPLAKQRLRERGFNQSEVLAGVISREFRLPMLTGLLRRVRNTQSQAETKTREERVANLQGAFACPQPAVAQGRQVLLIDDLSTTGSTLDNCASVLKAAGTDKVIGFVLARN